MWYYLEQLKLEPPLARGFFHSTSGASVLAGLSFSTCHLTVRVSPSVLFFPQGGIMAVLWYLHKDWLPQIQALTQTLGLLIASLGSLQILHLPLLLIKQGTKVSTISKGELDTSSLRDKTKKFVTILKLPQRHGKYSALYSDYSGKPLEALKHVNDMFFFFLR